MGNELDRVVRPFPWHTLERLPREVVTSLADVRRAISAAIDPSKVAEVLGELVGDRVTVQVARIALLTGPATALGSSVRFAMTSIDDSVRVELELGRELARALVARVLARPLGMTDPSAAAMPELSGAACAVIAAVARRAHGDAHALIPLGEGGTPWPEGERRVRVDAALTMGAESFAVRAIVHVLRPRSVPPRTGRADLAALGWLPIRVPVVAAQSVASASEVFALSAGDVWLPGEGWTVARRASSHAEPAAITGRVLLGGSSAERAIAATLGERGDLVVGGVEPMRIDQPAEETGVSERADTATSEVVLDAPLVVRVEMGAVSMSAREWAALLPGDVIAVGRRIAEPVLLRVGGVEVARGELVDVEGELGVRIRERVGAP